MSTKLRVLMVEDCEDDAFLTSRELRRGGLIATIERVDNEEALVRVLDLGSWDIALVDFFMPRFSGLEALALILRIQPELPVIMVSANVGEEAAVHSLQAGAQDYVVKGKMRRLVPAVQRALANAEERRERVLVEQSLREAEERYRALFDRSLDAVYIIDLEGHVVDANEAAARITGYTRRELRSKDYAEMLGPEQTEIVARFIGEVIATGATLESFEYEITRKDGTQVVVEAQASLIFRDGRPFAIQAMARDITDRKRAEAVLLEREERLRQIADNMLDMIAVTDTESRFSYLSPSNQKVLGYPPEEMLGRGVFEFVHPDDLPGVIAAAQAGVEEGRAGRQEFRFRHAAGHYLWVESVGNPLFDADGVFLGSVFGSRDISDRKEMEIALRRREEYARLLIANATDVVSIWDLEGEVRFLSPSVEKVLGYAPTELIGQNVAEMAHADDLHLLIPARAVDPEQLVDPRQAVCRFFHKDGSVRLLEGIGRIFTDPAGERLVLINSRDVTDRRDAERRERESQAQRVAALDSIGHGVLSCAATGSVELLNTVAQSLTGWSDEEAKGKQLSDIFALDGEQGQSVLDLLCDNERAAGTSTSVHEHLKLVTKSGDRLPVLVSAVRLQPSEEGGAVVVIVFRPEEAAVGHPVSAPAPEASHPPRAPRPG